MPLTLLEYAKAMAAAEEVRANVVATFAVQTALLQQWPMQSIAGSAYKHSAEAELPAVDFRGLNEAFNETSGKLTTQTDPLMNLGGDLDVDMFMVQTMGPQRRAAELRMKLKAIAHKFALTIVKGDNATNGREFTGLQKKLIGDQKFSNDGAGGALSLAKLDEAIDRCEDPTHLLMSKALRRILTQAARDQNLGGQIVQQPAEFGRQFVTFRGLPIIEADDLGNSQPVLGFNESDSTQGGTDNSSIYVLSLGVGRLSGIQSGPPDVRDLGEIDEKPVMRMRFSWNCNGCVLEHPRAAVRLAGVKDKAAVA